MRLTMLFTLLLLGAIGLRAGIVTRSIDYSSGGVTLKGYLAYDKDFTGKRPGILVVHE